MLLAKEEIVFFFFFVVWGIFRSRQDWWQSYEVNSQWSMSAQDWGWELRGQPTSIPITLSMWLKEVAALNRNVSSVEYRVFLASFGTRCLGLLCKLPRLTWTGIGRFACVIAIFFWEAVNHPNFSNTNVTCFIGFSVESLPLKHLICPILEE